MVDAVAKIGGSRAEGGRGGKVASTAVTGDPEVMCGELCVGVLDTGREEVCWVGTVALPNRRAFQST